MTARACQGVTKKGAACKSTGVLANGYCMAHQPEEEKESRGFGGSQPNAGRPAVPRITDVQRQLVRDNAVAILSPHFKALGYDLTIVDGEPVLTEREGGGAKLYGTSKDGHVKVSGYDDLGAMIGAAEKLLDRALGRPRQAVEHSGPEGGPVKIEGDVDLSRLAPEQLVQLRGLLADAAPDA